MTRTLIASMLASLLAFGAAVAHAAPAKPAAGKVHVATCRDGKEYYAETNEHRGACSGHGGVAVWTDGSPVKARGRKTEYRFQRAPLASVVNSGAACGGQL